MIKTICLVALLGFALVLGACLHTPNTTTATKPCEGNPTITSENDFVAMARCESISGPLRFDSQGWLTSIDMPRLTTVVGDLIIRSNDALTSVNTRALTSVGEDLGIAGNDSLASLNMPSLTTVDGSMIVGINNTLTSIDMPALTSVNGGLTIGANTALTSLEGMSGLTTVVGDLYLRGNDCLSQAEAEAFAARISVGGGVTVYDNGANYPCN